jgi:hypothetical protein
MKGQGRSCTLGHAKDERNDSHVCYLPHATGEPASFRTGVKGMLTLLVNSKTRVNAVLHTTFKGQKDRGHASGETHSHGVGN